MMKHLLFGLLLVAGSASSARAAGLQLTIVDGKVTLDAQDVTIRQILTEWARVGNTRIVNVERLSGGPVTIKLEALPEKQALDIILRTVPGYVAAPRTTVVSNASIYETILVMPTTTAVAAARPSPPAFGGPAGAGAPFGIPGVTQLRGPQPILAPDPEPMNPADDPAIAAAAAAGLLSTPPPAPGTSTVATAPLAPLTLPGQTAQPGTTTTPAPNNPWNAPAGTAQPSLAPPPAAATPPVVRPRAPQADR